MYIKNRGISLLAQNPPLQLFPLHQVLKIHHLEIQTTVWDWRQNKIGIHTVNEKEQMLWGDISVLFCIWSNKEFYL